MPISENLPPELRLLLRLLQAGLRAEGTDGLEPPAANLDWTVFDGLVHRHAVGGFLHHRVPLALKARLPVPVTLRWQETARKTARRAQTQSGELARLAPAFADAGIPLLSLKGPLLARRLYGAPGQRRAGDLDLLVAPENVTRADALLRAAGCTRTRPDFALTPRQDRAYRETQYEFEYVSAASGLRVELLWRLEHLPASTDLWTRAIPEVLDGRTLLTPPADVNACYLFQHGARHGWFRLFWLVDIALLLRDPAIDWTALVADARRQGIERPLLQGAALAHDLLGAGAPAAFTPSAGEQAAVQALCAEARRQLAGEADAGDRTVEWCRQLAYRVRLPRAAAAKLAVLRPHLVSLSSWKMVKLPDPLFGLYHVLTPFLWLWRRAAALRPHRSP